MTKQDLLTNSAHEIRRNPVLYAEFLRLYELDGLSIKGCQGCNFSNAYNKWKSDNRNLIKRKVMKNGVENTFILKKSVKIVFVPVISETITENSSDELVVKFLTQNDSKYFDKRKDAFFEKIPDSLLIKEIEVIEEVEVEPIKDEVQAQKSKRKRTPRKKK